MSAAVVRETATRKLRCSECGTMDESPGEFTQKDATEYAGSADSTDPTLKRSTFTHVAQFASLLSGRVVSASLRILVTHSELLRPEDWR